MPNPSSKDLNLSLFELQLIAKNRGIKGYESMSQGKLLLAPKTSKSEKSFDQPRIKKIRE